MEKETVSPLIVKPTENFICTKKTPKRERSEKIKFIGWGSKDLLDFLTAIGKDIEEPISQTDVIGITSEYIQVNGLINSDRKRRKMIVCDSLLYRLFRRKLVNRNKISFLLEKHFSENQIFDEFSCGSENETSSKSSTRQTRFISSPKMSTEMEGFMEKEVEVSKNYYASIIRENIKLIYLRRSLIERLLKSPETFEDKVMGSFVRVKLEPSDHSTLRNSFQLVEVVGVERILVAYKIREVTTDMVLRVSNVVKNIWISMISDDDFSVEECENLCQRMNQGLLKRPKVVELSRKARCLHEDLINHWIDTELAKLENLIYRANEKGWRREFYTLFEYIERKEVLETPEERLRLLREPPKVVPDTQTEIQDTSNFPEDVERVNKGKEIAPNGVDEKREDEGDVYVIPRKPKTRGRFKEVLYAFLGELRVYLLSGWQTLGNELSLRIKLWNLELKGTLGFSGISRVGLNYKGSVPYRGANFHYVSVDTLQSFGTNQLFQTFPKLLEELPLSVDSQEELEATGNLSPCEERVNKEESIKWTEIEKSSGAQYIIDLSDSEVHHAEETQIPSASVEIIDITDEEEMAEDERRADQILENQWIWNYGDPSGKTQGPFPLHHLREWHRKGYFNENFKVWRSDEAPEEAVLLSKALGYTLSDA